MKKELLDFATSRLCRDGRLDVELLRGVLAAAARKVDTAVEVIVPFGVEILEGTRSVPWSFTRIYACAYASEPCSTDRLAFCEAYVRQLILDLQAIDPVFEASIAVYRHSREVDIPRPGALARFGPTCRMVNVLFRTTATNALDDYARYVLISGPAIVDGSLGEAKRFGTDVRARRRLWQLGLMSLELLKKVGVRTDANLLVDLHRALRSYGGEFQQFVAGNRTSHPSEEEALLFGRLRDSLAMAHAALWAARPDVSTEIVVEDMYLGHSLRATLPEAFARKAIEWILRTYREFDAAQEPS